MKNYFLFALLAFITVSCAPAAARPAISYVATKAQIQDAVIAYSTSGTISSFYDGWRVTGITESSISLSATTTAATSALLANNTITLIVTMVARDAVTLVAISATDSQRRAVAAVEDQVLQFLDKRFARVPNAF